MITRNAPENQTDCNSLPDLFHTVFSKKNTPFSPSPTFAKASLHFVPVPSVNTDRNQKEKRKKEKKGEISRNQQAK